MGRRVHVDEFVDQCMTTVYCGVGCVIIIERSVECLHEDVHHVVPAIPLDHVLVSPTFVQVRIVFKSICSFILVHRQPEESMKR